MSRALSLAIALPAFALALLLALHHPIAPGWLAAAAVAWSALVLRHPRAWLALVPACVPWLDFAPWTGWTQPSEFDVLLLATLAAGHARRALDAAPAPWPAPRLCAALAALVALGLVRGLLDAPRLEFGWFDDAFTALNSVRASKSLLALLLWVPLLQRALDDDPAGALDVLFAGLLAGLAIATGAALWERATYPGLLDMSEPYRSTALFWEMHVGGAALDAYLALALPVVAWALLRARSSVAWSAAALLALAASYAALTSFARGLYLAAVVSLLVLALRFTPGATAHPVRRHAVQGLLALLAAALLLVAFAWLGYAGMLLVLGPAAVIAAAAVRRRVISAGWRTAAGAVLVLMLLAEAVTVLGPGTFMSERLVGASDDYDSRLAHWRRGIGLLHGPAEWLLGLGAGRLPWHYASFTLEGRPAGRVAWHAGRVRVDGPGLPGLRRGDYALAQRVPARPAYDVTVDVASTRGALVHARVCEALLLYDGACQATVRSIAPTRPGETRQLRWRLDGPPLRKPALWMLSVTDAGGSAEFDRIELRDGQGRALLANPGFDDGLAHWLPVARQHFLPWHIDNLVLEVLIERGVAGLLAFGALLAASLNRLLRGAARAAPEAPFLAASVCGVLTVGAVSSVLDVPRVTFLFGLLVLAGLLLRPAAGRTPPGTAPPSPAG